MNIVKNYVYYPFAVNLDRCVGSCKVCIPKKTDDLSLHVFNMIT